ncbi:hypothetical protein [Parabacteroides sp. ZJ-118]|uniref:hypothetical protein n=1 Tax=Parabacteroides sp. ZJ-118 TaxID=2709398 RepID=UPI0013EA6E06|nr:hypothetical protein [Parabacteroides sp. ZJ-118]
MDTPVLLITFNRPDYTVRMLDALKRCKVSNLYVFKDGPRPNSQSDKDASKEIENLVNAIDWDCNVNKLFLNNNLGCGYGPYTAISWAFGLVDELIILEDDCIPTEAFFLFCAEMLHKYRENKNVRHISGRSHLTGHKCFEKADYIFTQYAPTWGWATWKRTWDGFDMQMRELKNFFETGGYSNQFASEEEVKFFNKRYKNTIADTSMVFHVWDFQYGLHSRANNSLAIVPAKNLIQYIGVEGTHPATEESSYVTLTVDEGFKANRHPSKIEIDLRYERDHFKSFVSPNVNFLQKIKLIVLQRLQRYKK